MDQAGFTGITESAFRPGVREVQNDLTQFFTRERLHGIQIFLFDILDIFDCACIDFSHSSSVLIPSVKMATS